MRLLKIVAIMAIGLTGPFVFAEGPVKTVNKQDKVLGADGKVLNTPQAAIEQLNKAKHEVKSAEQIQSEKDKKALGLSD